MRFARAPRLAAVLALGLVLPWQAGCAAQYGAETAAQHRAQAWECGKGGYGVALCPPARRKAPVPSAAPAPPAEAGDECLKSGYGIPLCPSFGRRAAIPPSEVRPSEAAPAPPRKPQKDDCLKSGYGIPLCPSYGR
jgi:hypothetical protein